MSGAPQQNTLITSACDILAGSYSRVSSDPRFSIISMHTLLLALHYYFNYRHLLNEEAVYCPYKPHKIPQKLPHILSTAPTN